MTVRLPSASPQRRRLKHCTGISWCRGRQWSGHEQSGRVDRAPHGPRMTTRWPGVSTVGTVPDFAQDYDSVTFAACHGPRSAVVLDLAGQPYDRIVVTV